MAGKEKLTNKVSEQATQLTAQGEYLEQIVQRDAKVAALQAGLAKLDSDKTKALNHELETNSALRSDLAVAKRMRLTGTTCPAGTAPSGETHATSSMGDGAGIELSTETRYAVFDLRAGLVTDRAKLDYLQTYIRQNGLSPPDP